MSGFGNLDFYAGGRELPEGLYNTEYRVAMHQGQKADGTPAGAPRLCVMVNFTPIDERGNPAGEPTEKPISMGSKTHESWAPDPDTGKGLVAVPGGKGQGPTDKSNWFLYMKSAIDCGAPNFDNDISVWDGMWVRTQNIPEPEDRKSMQAATGEAGEQERRYNNKVTIVSEIPDAGKPWDGSGGLKGVAAAPAKPAAGAKKGPQGVVKPPAAAAKKTTAAPAAAAAAPDEEVAAAVESALTDILSENPSGMKKLKLRMESFKKIKAATNDVTANKALTDYFDNADALAGILGGLGFEVNDKDVVPQA